MSHTSKEAQDNYYQHTAGTVKDGVCHEGRPFRQQRALR